MGGVVMLKTILQIRKLLTGKQKSLTIQPGFNSLQEWNKLFDLQYRF
jgi:hypothetical protein